MNFKTAEELAKWLESLHAILEDDTVTDCKWEPAQVAANAIRAHLAGAWGIND